MCILSSLFLRASVRQACLSARCSGFRVVSVANFWINLNLVSSSAKFLLFSLVALVRQACLSAQRSGTLEFGAVALPICTLTKWSSGASALPVRTLLKWIFGAVVLETVCTLIPETTPGSNCSNTTLLKVGIVEKLRSLVHQVKDSSSQNSSGSERGDRYHFVFGLKDQSSNWISRSCKTQIDILVRYLV